MNEARHICARLSHFSPLIWGPCDSTDRDCRDIRITTHPPLAGAYLGVQQSVFFAPGKEANQGDSGT